MPESYSEWFLSGDPPEDHKKPFSSPSPSRPPRASRRESLKLPWSKSMRSKKQDRAKTGAHEGQQPSVQAASVTRNHETKELPDSRFCAFKVHSDFPESLLRRNHENSAAAVGTPPASPHQPGAKVSSDSGIIYSVAQILSPRIKRQRADKTNIADQHVGRSEIVHQHSRDKSFHVNLTPAQVEVIASEVYDETIHDTTLSLLTWWICDKPENYEIAKLHIRELGTDRVCPTDTA